MTPFAEFIKARHDIYLARKAGKPWPWTTDTVLGNYRFCNVYRELDTTTIWIDQNIRKPFADHRHLWLMLCIARYINWVPTLAELIETKQWPSNLDFVPSWLTTALEHRAARGEKVYTGAYMIRAETDPNKPWFPWTKHRYIAEIVIGRLWEDSAEWARALEPSKYGDSTTPTLESVWERFQPRRYIGWGPFMSYEVVTDLRHTRYLKDAADIYTWANAGPGALRGLNRLHGRNLNAKPNADQTNGEMRELMLELNALDEPGFNETFGEPREDPPRFEMRDVESCLCEMDKHQRVVRGEGKMRSTYDGRKARDLRSV